LDLLTHDVEERDRILLARNEELARTKADLERSQNRLTELETSTSVAEAPATGAVALFHSASQHRRWRSGFATTRRWKV
jgi:hypothetical protein